MTDMAAFIAQVVGLNGGELIGKTRLQKTIYFLERKKLGYAFDFAYHYYGPYSEDVAIAANDARARHLLSVDKEYTQRGDAYAVFHLQDYDPGSDVANLAEKERVLNILAEYSTVVIELAATADFLKVSGYPDPWPETCLRKSAKATPDRVELAKQLLARLGELENAHVSTGQLF